MRPTKKTRRRYERVAREAKTWYHYDPLSDLPPHLVGVWEMISDLDDQQEIEQYLFEHRYDDDAKRKLANA